MTSPAAGNIAGAITIAANALDNDKVASVQFQIDGANYGAPMTNAPFQITGYDTHLLGAGAHTFGAIATDRLGNVSTLATVVATVTNALPAAGTALLGDMIAWDGEEYSNFRSAPEGYDGSGGDWWWSVNGNKNPVYIPANPDPTHYQMRAWFSTTRCEGGTAGNVVYIDVSINGAARINPWANGTSPTTIFLQNINGGESFMAWRWCSIPGMNTCINQGIGCYYDFVLKPGYQS